MYFQVQGGGESQGYVIIKWLNVILRHGMINFLGAD